jgi:hypothetical protein
MRLRLDGHRLTDFETVVLLGENGLLGMSNYHVAEGYRLNPVRAPRRMENGAVAFQVSWTRRVGSARATLRLRVVMDATPV